MAHNLKLKPTYLFCKECSYSHNGVLDIYCKNPDCVEHKWDGDIVFTYNQAIDDVCKELEKEELWGHFGLSQLEEIQQKLLKLKKTI